MAQNRDFTLDDFRKQVEQLKRMGSLRDLIGRPPGVTDMIPEGVDPDQAMKRIQGMIDSMTKKERGNTDVIDSNRRRRIASGSGTEPQEVDQFIHQFEMIGNLMRQMAKMSIFERLEMVTGLGKMGPFWDPGV